jgi:hypothetical protein
MKRFLLFIFIVSKLLPYNGYGQSLSVREFLNVFSPSPKKFDSYLGKKNFVSISKWFQNDTIINTYSLKTKKKARGTVSVTRIIETYQKGKDFSFAFNTSSQEEYTDAKKELRKEGFFCGNEDDTCNTSLFFQRKNISVLVNTIIKEDCDTVYSFLFHEEELPLPASIHYAEDLLQFSSHEYLISVFGEKNVKKDLYYFSEKEINRCSILFPRTKRQAVFIWKDEANLCQLSSVIIGGNIPTANSISYKEVIAENNWMSKDGVYLGMSLNSLSKLNGNDFKFYGKNSEFPFMVVPENSGAINFKRNVVVLGCLSPNGTRLLDKAIVHVNEALSDDPGMYVFMIMVLPPAISQIK